MEIRARGKVHEAQYGTGGFCAAENLNNTNNHYGDMGYEHVNSKGIKYFLNSTLGGRNGRTIYFFSKEPKSPCDLPAGFVIAENPLTKLPLLKKKWAG